jgi:hypothetical protein
MIMGIDSRELYHALRRSSAAGVSGSVLFEKLLRGRNRNEFRDDPFLSGTRQFIAEERDRFLKTEIPHLPWSLYKLFDTTGDRLLFQAGFYERRRRLLILSLSVWLWERQEDIAALEDCIWALCDEYSWCLPAHMAGTSLLPPGSAPDIDTSWEFGDTRTEAAEAGGRIVDNRTRLDLFACETGFALAECCAMLETKLDRMVVHRARSEVTRRIITSYREHGGMWNWEIMSNNWCAVVAGSIAGAAMYLIADDMLLAGILAKLLPVFDRYLDSFTAEGVSPEGVSYWTYGLSFYVSAADLLQLRSGIDLLSSSRFAVIAAFQQQCYFPGGAVLRFSDVGDGDLFRLGLSCYLAEHISGVKVPAHFYRRTLESGSLLDHCGRFCAGLRDLLWTRERVPLSEAEPGAVTFHEAQWLLCTGAGGIGFACKGGHNGESHNHNDVGNFIYYQKGRMILCDLGAGEYNKEYFGKGRYKFLCNNSFGHSVPIIDGAGQKEGAEYGARSFAFGAEGEAVMDIAGAYGQSGLASLERRFRFDIQTGVLFLRDTFGFSGKPLPVTERLVTLIEPRFEDGKLFIPSEDGNVFITPGSEARISPPAIGREIHRTAEKEITVYTIDYAFVPESGSLTVTLLIGENKN